MSKKTQIGANKHETELSLLLCAKSYLHNNLGRDI